MRHKKQLRLFAFGRFVFSLRGGLKKETGHRDMKRLPKINKADYKFVPVNPDPGFSPEHNAMVIENSIKKYEAMRRKKLKEHSDQVEERSEALAFYMKKADMGGANSNMNKFFGKSYMDYLKGRTIKRIQDQLKVAGSDGRLIRSAGDVKARS